MKIATWNVNSLKMRLPHVLDWLDLTKTDILCLQELKMTDELFPIEAIEDKGYGALWSGQKTYNGENFKDVLNGKISIDDFISVLNVEELQALTRGYGCMNAPQGVAGNAGLFSNANDLAKIMSVYLNNGRYGGEHYIDSSTVALFTRTQLPAEQNRRGLGFDKPDRDHPDNSPACPEAPASSYGHTGFTGTMAWNDPDNGLIYIFLSNRTYPNEYNNKLMKENIRTKIQEVIYQAINGL